MWQADKDQVSEYCGKSKVFVDNQRRRFVEKYPSTNGCQTRTTVHFVSDTKRSNASFRESVI